MFISSEQGLAERIQFILVPGITEGKFAPRIEKMDYETGKYKSDSGRVAVASKKTDGGYNLEVLLPFDALGFKKAKGQKLGFNWYINYMESESGRPKRHSWHYFHITYANPNAQYLLLLEQEGNPDLMTLKAYLEDRKTYHVSILGNDKMQRKKVTIRAKNKGIASFLLDNEFIQSGFQIKFDIGQLEKIPQLDIYLGNDPNTNLVLGKVFSHYVHLPEPHKFEEAITVFEQMDMERFPSTNGTLFIESSTIRLWPSLKKTFQTPTSFNVALGDPK